MNKNTLVVLYITSTNIVLEGIISSNGEDATGYSGAGSGGSIQLQTSVITCSVSFLFYEIHNFTFLYFWL